MRFITANGETDLENSAPVEETPISESFESSLRDAIGGNFEEALNDSTFNQQDLDWAALGQQPVGQESSPTN